VATDDKNIYEEMSEGYSDNTSVTAMELDEVEDVSHEDAGIGHYEFWGETGYDSDPYYAVEGTIIEACSCRIVFEVEPVDEAPTTEETAEENEEKPSKKKNKKKKNNENDEE
jgi:hypothetical protein